MNGDEKYLLEKARNGDVGAFEQLIEGYRKKVFNIAMRMIGNPDDAGDLAQEVFIRVYRSVRNFKGESSFSTWIYKITTNICMDELRRRRNRRLVSIDEDVKLDDCEVWRQLEDDKPSPEAMVERNEVRKVVNDAIRSLPEHHRIIIILRDMQGLSYEEIAGIIKSPEGTVKSRINRARQALRKALEGEKELFDGEFVI